MYVYIYIYNMFVLFMQVCVVYVHVYVVKKVHHSRVHGQLMGVVHNDECTCIKYSTFKVNVLQSQRTL